MWRRASRNLRANSETTPLPMPQRPPATVTLRPMTEEEFAALKARMYEEYPRDVARGMGVPVEDVREQATKQIDDLMSEGTASESHRYWKIVARGDGAVGDLWVHLRREKHQSFIYFIGVDDAQRGKGYARAAMLALESELKPLGITSIGLNVFGDNTTARHLYESLGYQPSAINMRKEI